MALVLDIWLICVHTTSKQKLGRNRGVKSEMRPTNHISGSGCRAHPAQALQSLDICVGAMRQSLLL